MADKKQDQQIRRLDNLESAVTENRNKCESEISALSKRVEDVEISQRTAATAVNPENTVPNQVHLLQNTSMSNINNQISTDGSPAPQRETAADGGRSKLTTADFLKRLWNFDLHFRDQFSAVLDLKYARVKYWVHLAEQFGIDRNIYDGFSTSDINSPTERLFDYLGAKQPTYSVKEFCKDCKNADAYEVSRIVEEKIAAGILDNEDRMRKIRDKAPSVRDKIVLQLDREKRLWQNLARERGIDEDEYLTFESDKTNNPTRLFFDLLRTQGPDITVGDFKEKSKKLNLGQILEILKDSRIKDEVLLTDLSRHSPDVKTAIESFLNNLQKDFLWNLANLYQKEGLMEDIDLELEFRYQEDCHSPTRKMMEYVLASRPEKYTIEDLIIRLWKIKRKDCFSILYPYLRGGKDDVDKIIKGLEKLQGEGSEERRQASTGEDRPSTSSIPATDQANSQYVI